MTKVQFIVDCGPDAGMGHLSRARTLAEALSARGAETLIAVTDLSGLGAGAALLTPDAGAGADMIVVDGERFSAGDIAGFRAVFRARGVGLFVVVDDMGARPVEADVLINQNIYGERIAYPGYQCRTFLLGPSYALIRPAFAAAREGRGRRGPRALVSFGGGRTGAIGVAVAARLAGLFAGPIDVALGHYGGDCPVMPANVRMLREADMPRLMAEASVYVGALGVTFLEALAAGLAPVAACVADNQRLALEAARALGLPVFAKPDPSALAAAASAALGAPPAPLLDQPDGRGAARTADALMAALSERLAESRGEG